MVCDAMVASVIFWSFVCGDDTLGVQVVLIWIMPVLLGH